MQPLGAGDPDLSQNCMRVKRRHRSQHLKVRDTSHDCAHSTMTTRAKVRSSENRRKHISIERLSGVHSGYGETTALARHVDSIIRDTIPALRI